MAFLILQSVKQIQRHVNVDAAAHKTRLNKMYSQSNTNLTNLFCIQSLAFPKSSLIYRLCIYIFWNKVVKWKEMQCGNSPPFKKKKKKSLSGPDRGSIEPKVDALNYTGEIQYIGMHSHWQHHQCWPIGSVDMKCHNTPISFCILSSMPYWTVSINLSYSTLSVLIMTWV